MQTKQKVQRVTAPSGKKASSKVENQQIDAVDLEAPEDELSQPKLAFDTKSGKPTIRPESLNTGNVLRLQNVLGNRAVRRLLAKDGVKTPQPAPRKLPVQRQVTSSPKVIQRTYAALPPMGKARIDQQSDEKYSEKTAEFEFGMASLIMESPEVNKVVDVMLGRVNRIVQAWAQSTGRDLRASYEREFGWSGGDDYYGAFEMTADNIITAFTDKTQPMRTKLKLVYNAVRNNNLSKWLKVAATELDQKARGKKAAAQKIKTSTGSVLDRTGKVRKNVAEKEEVQAGFADKSGISSWMTPDMRSNILGISTREKKTDKSSSKRDVFGHDRFSGVMGWKDSTHKANAERKGGANRGLAISEQRTLGTKDIGNLTDAEIEFMYKRQNKPVPDKTEKDRFRTDPTAKTTWSQGGEFYDIELGSDSAKEASEIKARMEAGISGSTDLMLHAMENLGISRVPALMKGMRMALAGWMLANRDHSFYEIFKASESYGMEFETDKVNPGKEYESVKNLSPMKPADFQNVLPEHVFPRYFLSSAYKDTLSNTLGDAAKTQDNFKQDLQLHGVKPDVLNTLNAKDTAELNRLAELVQNQAISSDLSLVKRNQAVRQIKLSSSFVYLGNKLGMVPATGLLNSLLGTHHSGKGLLADKDDIVKTLADAGIPRTFMVGRTTPELNQLEKVRQVIQGAGVDPVTKVFNSPNVVQELAKLTRFPQAMREVIKAVLVKTYYGITALNEDENLRANAAQTMAGHQESGVKKMTTAQLNSLKAPTSQEGNKISDRDYFEAASARHKLQGNLGIMAESYLNKINKVEDEKTRVRNALLTQIGGNDPTFVKDFKELEKAEGFTIAVSSHATPDFIKNFVLPDNDKKALEGLGGLHDKELGSIFQYTTSLYKPIVASTGNLSTANFKNADKKNHAWDSSLGTLKYTGPMLQALSSGLAKLPVYGEKVYRLDTTNTPLLNMSLEERRSYAERVYPVGTIKTQNYPMSTSKTLNSQFAATNYGNPTFSVVFEITNVKSGHDIQFVSDKVNEEEVLFAPGSSLRVTAVFPHKPNDPSDKHVWVQLEEV